MDCLPRKLRLTKEQWEFNLFFLATRIISYQDEKRRNERGQRGYRWRDLEMLKTSDNADENKIKARQKVEMERSVAART